MVNKLIIDGVNTELNDKTPMPYTYTFSQAKKHSVKIALDNTDEICAEAFKDCPRLTSITFPEEIRMIKRRAFENCTGLTSITIPETIEYIGANVFDGCKNLKEVDFIGTNPPDVYCKWPSGCTCFVPNDSKYLQVSDITIINLDKKTQYYTKTFYGSYEPIANAANMTPETTYYYNNWDSINLTNSDVTLEYKDRVPIEAIEFTAPRINLSANSLSYITYTLIPENETNHRITWVSGNTSLIDVIATTENTAYLQIANIEKNTTAGTTLTAYAESGAWTSVKINIAGGTAEGSTTPGDNPGDSGSGDSGSGDSGSGDSGSEDTTIAVTSISARKNIGTTEGDGLNLNVTVKPDNATDKSVTITSNRTLGVDLTDDDILVFENPGNYELTITSNSNPNITYMVNLEVAETAIK